MKPTIEEVKAYFKNAEIVEGRVNGKFNISKVLNTLEWHTNAYVVTQNNWITHVWDERGYIEIISYKVEETIPVKKSVLLQLADNNSFSEEILKKEVPQLFESELEVGRWYKSPSTGKAICYLKEIKDNKLLCYGFNYKEKWCDLKEFGEVNNHLTPATTQEITEALTKEAVKRYKSGDYVVGLWKNYKGSIDLDYNTDFKIEENELWHGGFLVFKQGQWAQPIETITKAEAEKRYNIVIVC